MMTGLSEAKVGGDVEGVGDGLTGTEKGNGERDSQLSGVGLVESAKEYI